MRRRCSSALARRSSAPSAQPSRALPSLVQAEPDAGTAVLAELGGGVPGSSSTTLLAGLGGGHGGKAGRPHAAAHSSTRRVSLLQACLSCRTTWSRSAILSRSVRCSRAWRSRHSCSCKRSDSSCVRWATMVRRASTSASALSRTPPRSSERVRRRTSKPHPAPAGKARRLTLRGAAVAAGMLAAAGASMGDPGHHHEEQSVTAPEQCAANHSARLAGASVRNSAKMGSEEQWFPPAVEIRFMRNKSKQFRSVQSARVCTWRELVHGIARQDCRGQGSSRHCSDCCLCDAMEPIDANQFKERALRIFSNWEVRSRARWQGARCGLRSAAAHLGCAPRTRPAPAARISTPHLLCACRRMRAGVGRRRSLPAWCWAP